MGYLMMAVVVMVLVNVLGLMAIPWLVVFSPLWVPFLIGAVAILVGAA